MAWPRARRPSTMAALLDVELGFDQLESDCDHHQVAANQRMKNDPSAKRELFPSSMCPVLQ